MVLSFLIPVSLRLTSFEDSSSGQSTGIDLRIVVVPCDPGAEPWLGHRSKPLPFSHNWSYHNARVSHQLVCSGLPPTSHKLGQDIHHPGEECVAIRGIGLPSWPLLIASDTTVLAV